MLWECVPFGRSRRPFRLRMAQAKAVRLLAGIVNGWVFQSVPSMLFGATDSAVSGAVSVSGALFGALFGAVPGAVFGPVLGCGGRI
ncbi:MAG: hypothetical protein EON54_08080 [Alcaligenaceae bacterium]|nr:MAG: hypothetical protein EON54_08080 [Alcaligenaceae bacterium]